jgi:hypothetical protein
MKIVAIASLPLDLELACFGTLSRCIKNGHEVHILVAKSKRDSSIWTKMKMETLRKVSRLIGVSQVYFTDRFDYSSVTQDNAKVITSFLTTIDPSLVIMPFWKACNQKRKILAKTSVVACRGIGSLLMYELERNTNFVPTVYFEISPDDISTKTSSLAEYGTLAPEVGLGRKANFFNLDLLTTKKYKLPLLPQIAFSVANTDSVVFDNDANTEVEKLETVENNQDNEKRTRREIKQRFHRLYSRKAGMDALVEVFESHRILLLDHADGI